MNSVSHISYKGEWMPLSKVEFVNIEEDFSGRDLVTFRKDGREHQSFVTLRPSGCVKEATTEHPCHIAEAEEGSLEEFDRYIAGDR